MTCLRFRDFAASVASLNGVFTMPIASITGTGIDISFDCQVVAIKIVDVFPQLGRFSSTLLPGHADHVSIITETVRLCQDLVLLFLWTNIGSVYRGICRIQRTRRSTF